MASLRESLLIVVISVKRDKTIISQAFASSFIETYSETRFARCHARNASSQAGSRTGARNMKISRSPFTRISIFSVVCEQALRGERDKLLTG